MQKVFEKIIKKLQDERASLYEAYKETEHNIDYGALQEIGEVIKIINQLAEECVSDTKVNHVAWETIYRRLLEVIDEYAAVADIANVKDCKVLSDLLRHYKEQLTEEFKPKSFQTTQELKKDNKSLNNHWIPVEERYPDTKDYILLSFDNFPVPQIGRWEEDENGGAFYIGDEEETCVQQDLFVNAWQPIKPYRPEEN